MRDLNEIVTRNAVKLIADAQRKARSEGRRLTVHTIAGRMAEMLGEKQDTVRKHLARCLKGKASWRANDIQALGAALGEPYQGLIELDAKALPEATIAQQLFAGLNHRLDGPQTRALLRRLHRQLDDATMFDLIQQLTDRLLDAETKDVAYEAAHELIRKSEAWGSKRRELRGVRVSDK